MKQYFKIPDMMHPTENVDRARRRQRFRLSCGIHVDSHFRRVQGMLVVSNTCGRWLKPQIFRTVRVEIPSVLSRLCQVLTNSSTESITLPQLKSAANDLAGLEAQATSLLLSGSVKVLDNVLAICVSDPGIYYQDFDGKPVYQSLCDSQRLAELTGLSVIDGLPARDLIVGGQGRPLGPLPYWLLFADRDLPFAKSNRCLLNLDSPNELVFLPASDGLDAELPEIAYRSLIDIDFMDDLLASVTQNRILSDHDGKLAVQGKFSQEILQVLEQHLALNSDAPIRAGTYAERSQQLGALAADLLANDFNCSDLLCTIQHSLADVIAQQIETWNQRQLRNTRSAISEIVLAGKSAANGLLQQLIGERFPTLQLRSSDEFGIPPADLPLMTTALLGLMHIDQFPANMPGITGADCPRILGQLTPGSPSNWRRLLVEMTDYRPPAMKLRDAV
jgi:1,6-anhydro-N-acetylmuramate kinase